MASQITLTLAGLGGFIASIGMAVDANVLIFERMKEEFRAGRTLGAAIEAGFNRAWSAIRDSNITTFIACIILIMVGSNVASGERSKVVRRDPVYRCGRKHVHGDYSYPDIPAPVCRHSPGKQDLDYSTADWREKK